MSGHKIIESGQRFIGFSNAEVGGCDNAEARRRLADFLRRMAPHDTAKVVGRGSRTPPATVYKWIAEEAFPNGFALIRLWRLYGVVLLIEVFGSQPDQIQLMLDRAARRQALMAEVDALDRLGPQAG